ncbi:MAG: 16S rRNA (guanine(527)-N(7))-methyltransferase RsmG [Anaerofustis stercorihominis]|nr:16S rRNA (guanine(527)-N(7))-methyltransferase RsmG [Anaerofustis stercorihominis]
MSLSAYFDKCAQENGISVSSDIKDKLLMFMEEVLAENKIQNLTAITDEKDFIELHLIDCLKVTPHIGECAKVIDIGTGAGFPGMVIKIARPDVDITLIDSLNKRIEFLKRTAQKLGLENIRCIHGRAEEMGRKPEFRAQFDIAISRAVARLSVLSEYCIPYVNEGGHFIAMKGREYREEIEEAQNAAKILGGDEWIKEEFELKPSCAVRSIISSRKIAATDEKYPRRAKKISSSPLR